MDLGSKANENPDLSVKENTSPVKDEVGLLTRTIPTSFVTRATQERREALMGKITRQHYGMEE